AEPGKNLVTLPNSKATAVLVESKGNKPVLKITPETLEENLPIEMPRINDDLDGVKHRYTYATTFYYCSHAKLAKYDVVEKKVTTFDIGTDHIPGETVFVARPDAAEEDDGVILSTVMACHAGVQSYLLVLDAASFQEIGRASLPGETKMGLAFHSMFTNKKFNM
ncbi:beta,beta-carotene 15,15'-monooxygenase, partial [Elysia marginata]